MDKIPILVMNMCISSSMSVAERWTSRTGKATAARADMADSMMTKRTPVKPANKAPSANPPVKNTMKMARKKVTATMGAT